MEKYCKYHVLDGAIWTVGWNIIYHRIWIVKRMRLVTGPEAYTNHVSAPIYTRKRADIVLILFLTTSLYTLTLTPVITKVPQANYQNDYYYAFWSRMDAHKAADTLSTSTAAFSTSAYL